MRCFLFLNTTVHVQSSNFAGFEKLYQTRDCTILLCYESGVLSAVCSKKYVIFCHDIYVEVVQYKLKFFFYLYVLYSVIDSLSLPKANFFHTQQSFFTGEGEGNCRSVFGASISHPFLLYTYRMNTF